MAYGVVYRTTAYCKGLGQVTVDILRKDYVGSIYPLTIAFEGIKLTVDTVDYFSSIISNSVDIDIINDKDDFYELDALFTGYDLQHMVKLYTDTLVIFNGFIPCDIVEQTWLKYGTITLTATSNLNRLDEYIPTLFETKGTYDLLTTLFHILSFTNLDLPIYINCSLREITQNNLEPLFPQTYAESDIFYEDSSTIKDCKTILEYILISSDCCIYYYDDAWYIERWRDMKGYLNNKLYYKYTSSSIAVEYINEDMSESLYPVIGEDLILIDTSQVIKYSPGLKKVEVTLNETLRMNLVDYYYDDFQEVDFEDLVAILCAFGYWKVAGDSVVDLYAGHYLNKMTNYVTITDHWINPAGNFDGVIYIDENGTYESRLRSLNGLYTKFKVHLNPADSTNPEDDVTTNLTIDFTVKIQNDEYFLSYFEDIIKSQTGPTFYARIILRYGTDKYVTYNSSTSKYVLTTKSDPAADENIPTINVSFKYSNFTNKTEWYYEFSTSLSLGAAIRDTTGENPTFTIGIVKLGFSNDFVNDIPTMALKQVTFGDIYVTANTSVDDNVITGIIGDDFVTVEEDDLYLYDSENYSISNGLCLDEDRTHTTLWSDDFHRYIYLTLMKYFIEDRFQIYHVVRHHITTDIQYIGFLKPFQMIVGNLNGDKVFCVNGYRYVLDSDRYESITFSEYVNDDNIS